jgi:oligopeptide transport system ATP-binding protein
MPEALLDARGLVKYFRRRRGLRADAPIRAVDVVDLRLDPSETLAVVGESGSGKSTVARIIVGLTRPDAGQVTLHGRDLLTLGGSELRRARLSVQIVFQDPQASFDPRMTVQASVQEPWDINRWHTPDQRERRAEELLGRVGLPADRAWCYPHQLSGGEAQRVAIARALALEPDVLVLDEPVSALDVSVQAQVLELLRDLQRSSGLAYLFITHDLAVVDQIADRVAVMYLGRIVETGSRSEVLGRPSHPYTQALVSAAPVPDVIAQRSRRRIILAGDPPDPADAPSGCRFRTRCWKAQDRCTEEEPRLQTLEGRHQAACHYPDSNGV